jgi:hypothetical protein
MIYSTWKLIQRIIDLIRENGEGALSHGRFRFTGFVASIRWKIEELPRSTPLPSVEKKPLSRKENPVRAGFFCFTPFFGGGL